MDTLLNDLILIVSGVSVWGITEHIIDIYIKPNNRYRKICVYVLLLIASLAVFVYVNRKKPIKNEHTQ